MEIIDSRADWLGWV